MGSSNGALTLAALVVVELAAAELADPEAPVREILGLEREVPEPWTEVLAVSNTGAMPEAATVTISEPEDKTRDWGIKRVE